MLAIAGGTAVLMALSAAAVPAAQSPRWLVLCALGGALAAAVVWRGVRRLAGRAAIATPAAMLAADDALLTPDRRALLAAAQSLEAHLEHAPMALFRIDGAGAVTALNAGARRLLAPGRASDPAQLLQLVAAQPAQGRTLIRYDTERGAERALVSVAALTVQGDSQRLAALMPVESELEAEAMQAWRQLVQVLTHEIMNSLTPVASLSRTACDLLAEARGDVALDSDLAADIATALDAIARRAASLVDFVGSYRTLSTVPPPQPERVRLQDLFARLAALIVPQWQAHGGMATFSVEPASLEVMLDPGQLEQALINLLKNALEAAQDRDRPAVNVQARLGKGGRLRIEMADNGCGVPDDLAAHIFTPFFSTKKQGRGIGLALVRQLVHANGGMVRHARPVGGGARFVLTF
jgi:C4-dicarboxylate-specific signal transduction histidine kinase